MSLHPNLLAWWREGVVEGAGFGNDIALTGAVESDGRIGRCLSFDGTDDYGSAADAARFRGLPEMTIAAWVYLTGYATGGTMPSRAIIVKGKGSLAAPYTYIHLVCSNAASDKWEFAVTNTVDTRYLVTSNAAATLNTWVHVAGVRTTTGIYLVVDGVKQADTTTTSGTTASPNVPITVGWGNLGNLPPGAYSLPWKGKIDSLSWWNAALSTRDIRRVMNDLMPIEVYNSANP